MSEVSNMHLLNMYSDPLIDDPSFYVFLMEAGFMSFLTLLRTCLALQGSEPDLTQGDFLFTRRNVTSCPHGENTRKKWFCYGNEIGTTDKIFVAATKNFATATKRFVDRTKHLVVVTKFFVIPILTNDFVSITKPFFPCSSSGKIKIFEAFQGEIRVALQTYLQYNTSPESLLVG